MQEKYTDHVDQQLTNAVLFIIYYLQNIHSIAAPLQSDRGKQQKTMPKQEGVAAFQ